MDGCFGPALTCREMDPDWRTSRRGIHPSYWVLRRIEFDLRHFRDRCRRRIEQELGGLGTIDCRVELMLFDLLIDTREKLHALRGIRARSFDEELCQVEADYWSNVFPPRG